MSYLKILTGRLVPADAEARPHLAVDGRGFLTLDPRRAGDNARAVMLRGGHLTLAGKLSVAADTQPPLVTLSASQASFTAPGSLTLTAEASDDVGVVALDIYRGELLLGAVASGGSLTEGVSYASNGTHVYRAVARDAAGNTGQSLPVTVTVEIPDTTPPVFRSLSAEPPSLTQAGTVRVLASVSDDVGVVSVTLYRGAALPENQIERDTSFPYDALVDLGAADNGTVRFTAVAADAAGNTAMKTVDVTVNIEAAPVAQATLTNDGDAFTLKWPASGSNQYVVYSAYAATGRMFVPISGWVQGTTFRDGNVKDEREVHYRVYRMVDGYEVLHAELSGTQPKRVWTDAVEARLAPGRYVGLNIQNLDIGLPQAVKLSGCSASQLYDFVDCRFQSVTRGLGGFFPRIRLRNCRFWGLYPGGEGRQHARALNLEEFRHADIQDCYFEDTSGVYLTQHDNQGAAGDTLIYKRNFTRNVLGMYTDGQGGYKTGKDDFYRLQALQIAKCKAGQTNKPYVVGLRGAEIMWNYVCNEPGFSRVEDVISFYQCHGFPDSKIKVWHNMIDGAYCYLPTVHTGFSGGGIMIGDEGGNNIDKQFNRVIRYSNYGISIMNGENNVASNNRAVRSPFLWDGSRVAIQPPSGLVAAQFWDYNRMGELMRNNSMNDNFLANQYQRADGTLVTNIDYITVAGKNGNEYLRNTRFKGNVTVAMEHAELIGWRDDLAAAGQTFGAAA